MSDFLVGFLNGIKSVFVKVGTPWSRDFPVLCSDDIGTIGVNSGFRLLLSPVSDIFAPSYGNLHSVTPTLRLGHPCFDIHPQ